MLLGNPHTYLLLNRQVHSFLHFLKEKNRESENICLPVYELLIDLIFVFDQLAFNCHVILLLSFYL